MIRNPFYAYENFAKDSGIYEEGKDWNIGIERLNLRIFDMKTSLHKAAIFSLCVPWIVLAK